ncbi:Hypothetical protein D9617_14g077890 [Elsinoe fawcettii]|nr:Hypothetical protein D9617_14g077890 [Elsinoe fawcettii]
MQHVPLIAFAGKREAIFYACDANAKPPSSRNDTPNDSPGSTERSTASYTPSIPRRHPARHASAPLLSTVSCSAQAYNQVLPPRNVSAPMQRFPSTDMAGLAYQHLQCAPPDPPSSSVPEIRRGFSYHTAPASALGNPIGRSYSSVHPSHQRKHHRPSLPSLSNQTRHFSSASLPAELPGSFPPSSRPSVATNASSSSSSRSVTATPWAVIHIQPAIPRPDDQEEPRAVYLLKRLLFDASGSTAGEYTFLPASPAAEISAWTLVHGNDGVGQRFTLPDGGMAVHVPCEETLRPTSYIRCEGTGGALADGEEVYVSRAARWRLRAGRWAVEGCLRMCVKHNARFECGCTVPRLAGRRRETVRVYVLNEGELEGKMVEDGWERARGWSGGDEAGVKRRERRQGRGIKRFWRKVRGLCGKMEAVEEEEGPVRDKGEVGGHQTAQDGFEEHELQPTRTNRSSTLAGTSTEDRQIFRMRTLDPRLTQGSSDDELLPQRKAIRQAVDEITPVDQSRIDSTRPTPIIKQEGGTSKTNGAAKQGKPLLPRAKTENCCTAGCLRAELYARFHDQVCGCGGLGKKTALKLYRNPVRTKLGMLGDGCIVLLVKLKDAWTG